MGVLATTPRESSPYRHWTIYARLQPSRLHDRTHGKQRGTTLQPIAGRQPTVFGFLLGGRVVGTSRVSGDGHTAGAIARCGLDVRLLLRVPSGGNKRAELRMNVSSDATWMNAAINGFNGPAAASTTPIPSTAKVPAKLKRIIACARRAIRNVSTTRNHTAAATIATGATSRQSTAS